MLRNQDAALAVDRRILALFIEMRTAKYLLEESMFFDQEGQARNALGLKPLLMVGFKVGLQCG